MWGQWCSQTCSLHRDGDYRSWQLLQKQRSGSWESCVPLAPTSLPFCRNSHCGRWVGHPGKGSCSSTFLQVKSYCIFNSRSCLHRCLKFPYKRHKICQSLHYRCNTFFLTYKTGWEIFKMLYHIWQRQSLWRNLIFNDQVTNTGLSGRQSGYQL